MFVLLALTLAKQSDTDMLITEELVDKINNDPHSSFKAELYPKFASLTIGEAKKFLRPLRKTQPRTMHSSPLPVGVNEKYFTSLDKRILTGFYKRDGTATAHSDPAGSAVTQWDSSNKWTYTVYDNTRFCSSWAPAVTSAMSLALSIHHKKFVNLSIQFLLDCDLLGDPCIERPALNAYEQFWRRYIPQADRWDQPDNVLRTPPRDLTSSICNAKSGCYPGWTSCPRNLAMTGTCDLEENDMNCPIYYLYNWRWMKSHLWEVGPLTSTMVVRKEFFAYSSGVYSSIGTGSTLSSGNLPSTSLTTPLGMLDVTIIGWGQWAINMSRDTGYHTGWCNRWWYVIPHLGTDWGENCSVVFGSLGRKNVGYINDTTIGSIERLVNCPGTKSGIMRVNRRFDDSSIESMAVGAVPFNFVPKKA